MHHGEHSLTWAMSRRVSTSASVCALIVCMSPSLWPSCSWEHKHSGGLKPADAPRLPWQRAGRTPSPYLQPAAQGLQVSVLVLNLSFESLPLSHRVRQPEGGMTSVTGYATAQPHQFNICYVLCFCFFLEIILFIDIY